MLEGKGYGEGLVHIHLYIYIYIYIYIQIHIYTELARENGIVKPKVEPWRYNKDIIGCVIRV
jgi:hypothetical protein